MLCQALKNELLEKVSLLRISSIQTKTRIYVPSSLNMHPCVRMLVVISWTVNWHGDSDSNIKKVQCANYTSTHPWLLLKLTLVKDELWVKTFVCIVRINFQLFFRIPILQTLPKSSLLVNVCYKVKEDYATVIKRTNKHLQLFFTLLSNNNSHSA